MLFRGWVQQRACLHLLLVALVEIKPLHYQRPPWILHPQLQPEPEFLSVCADLYFELKLLDYYIF